MSRLEINDLVKRFDGVTALAGAGLTVPAGRLTAVLGPSGCGKTTLLKCVTGFERADGGEIRVGGQVLSGPGRHVPPHRRRVAIVPQEGALFPHLSVLGNVLYGLDRADRRTGRAEEMLALVGLDGYGHRMPHQLSGGQQQRVAVARALAPRPSLILLDEPFSALDAGLRTEVREDVRAALRAAGATAVIVTHDQVEALSLADEVAVMRGGTVLQSGPPTSVYHRPADAWVAGFVGEANLLPGTTRAGTAGTALGSIPLAEPPPGEGTPVTVLVRPEQIGLGPAPDGRAGVRATVTDLRFHGRDWRLTLHVEGRSGDPDGGTTVLATLPGTAHLAVGDTVDIHCTGPAHHWPASAPAHEDSVLDLVPGPPD